jgi:hypothetical protein
MEVNERLRHELFSTITLVTIGRKEKGVSEPFLEKDLNNVSRGG